MILIVNEDRVFAYQLGDILGRNEGSEDDADMKPFSVHVGEVEILGDLVELPGEESVGAGMEGDFVETVDPLVLLAIPVHGVHPPEPLVDVLTDDLNGRVSAVVIPPHVLFLHCVDHCILVIHRVSYDATHDRVRAPI